MFSSKFTCARTKTEAIVTNVLAPLSIHNLEQDLEAAMFVSVSCDASNHNSVKFLPVLVRYFVPSGPNSGIKNKVLTFSSVKRETSEILSDHVVDVLQIYKLTEKLIAFSADNTNANFGGVLRRGQNNIFFRLKTQLGKELIGIGCAAHVVHNCAKTASDTLPVDVEVIVNKIFSYFHIYTVRVERLKTFCEYVESEFKQILNSGNTRWLSLMPAVERILQMFDALKEFYSAEEKCPVVLKQFFENPCSELWLWFTHNQLALFNATILKMERSVSTAVEVCSDLAELKEKLQNRKTNKFLSIKVKQLLSVVKASGCITDDDFWQIAQSFYQTALEYFGMWEISYAPFRLFSWVCLRGPLSWGMVEKSLEELIKMLMPTGHGIDDNALFDEVTCVCSFVTQEKVAEWNENNVAVDSRWMQIFNSLQERDIILPNLKMILQFLLAIPGTNAPVERVFSLMNSYWSDEEKSIIRRHS